MEAEEQKMCLQERKLRKSKLGMGKKKKNHWMTPDDPSPFHFKQNVNHRSVYYQGGTRCTNKEHTQRSSAVVQVSRFSNEFCSAVDNFGSGSNCAEVAGLFLSKTRCSLNYQSLFNSKIATENKNDEGTSRTIATSCDNLRMDHDCLVRDLRSVFK